MIIKKMGDVIKVESAVWIRKAEGDLRKAKILFQAGEYDGANSN